MSRLPVDERRDQLTSVAVELAAHGGFAAVTSRAVAREAGVSLGVVHYCFDDKDALVAAVIKSVIDDQLVAFLGLLDFSEVGTGPEAVQVMAERSLVAIIDQVIARPERALLLIESVAFTLRKPPSASTSGYAMVQRSYALRAAAEYFPLLGEKCGVVWPASLDAVARFTLAHVDGTIQWWVVDRDDEAARQSMRLLAQWLGQQARPVAAALD